MCSMKIGLSSSQFKNFNGKMYFEIFSLKMLWELCLNNEDDDEMFYWKSMKICFELCYSTYEVFSIQLWGVSFN